MHSIYYRNILEALELLHGYLTMVVKFSSGFLLCYGTTFQQRGKRRVGGKGGEREKGVIIIIGYIYTMYIYNHTYL